MVIQAKLRPTDRRIESKLQYEFTMAMRLRIFKFRGGS